MLEKSAKRNLSQKEKKELNKLRDDEQNLDKKISKISSILESDALVNKILTVLTPFRVVIGVVFLSISILILLSLFITSLDRVKSLLIVSILILLADWNADSF